MTRYRLQKEKTSCNQVWLWRNYSCRNNMAEPIPPSPDLQLVLIQVSFVKTGCHTKAKEPSLLYYLSISSGRLVGFIPFFKGISAMGNANSLIQNLDLSS